jgi:hypothetical protein
MHIIILLHNGLGEQADLNKKKPHLLQNPKYMTYIIEEIVFNAGATAKRCVCGMRTSPN